MTERCKRGLRFLPHGLFWRVFLIIGASILVSALLSFSLFYISSAHHLERVFAQDYTGLSNKVRNALDEGALVALQSQFQEDKRATLVVLEGKKALGTRPPHWVMSKLRRNREHHMRNKDGDHRDFELMQSRLQHRGRNYRIVILPIPGAFQDAARPLVLLSLLGMLTLTSSMIAWMFTRPLREVQSAARQLSTGDTTARVSSKVALRRDSIGELGADFNHMAKRIQHLLDAQRQLLRDVSHELRTPLARMQVALVLAQDKPETAAKQLERIDAEIERLNALIGSILSLSKVESGAATLNESKFSLDKLLQTVAQDAEFEFANTAVRAVINCPPTMLFGDRGQLHSALENIVRNAMRYSEKAGEIRLDVDKQDGELSIRIRDHGPGVEPTQLARLFEAFYRAESARSAQSSGGHGVGLAIARSIVSLHGGHISAANATDGGLEVIITLAASRVRKEPLIK